MERAFALGKTVSADLPICRAVYNVLYKGENAHDEVNALFTRSIKMSFELQGSGTYEDVVLQAKALIEDEPELVPNIGKPFGAVEFNTENITGGLYTVQPDGNLLLGPFQGKPACIRIKAGRGVCGTALAEKKTLRVADVHAFPGHIACDSASRAEIVVPVMKDGKVYAVLDVDSPFEDRFTAEDEAFLEKIAALLAKKF